MLFLTAYDPQGRSAGSVDPLGALQSYTALAELLLPGVTTITSRSRYLSLLCAALRAARHRPIPPGPAGVAARRQAVLGYERLWAAACVLIENEGSPAATDGLRGVSYVRDEWPRFQEQGRIDPDFQMLKAQERTGGVGTYWVALAGAGLIERDSGALTVQGQELAGLFPHPGLGDADLGRLAEPGASHRVRLSLDSAREWGSACHLGAASAQEKQRLRDALTAAPRRAAVARALTSFPERPERWDAPALKELQQRLGADEEARRLGLPVVLEGIRRAETFHEAALALFGRALWWGTEQWDQPVGDLLALPETAFTLEGLRSRAASLHAFSLECDSPQARQALASLVPFAAEVAQARSADEVFRAVLARHHRVQSGKLDGGMPKRDWVTQAEGGRLLRPAPNFQMSAPPAVPTGDALTHPYRLEPFARMLAENDFFGDPMP